MPTRSAHSSCSCGPSGRVSGTATADEADGYRKVVTKYGHTVYVDPEDEIGQRILRNRIFDASSLRLIVRLLKLVRPRRVLDVGANIGNHALVLSLYCGEAIAFEPGSRAYALLRRNIEANPDAAATAYRVGLSDHDGTARLFLDAEGSLGRSSLVEHPRDTGADSEVIMFRRGDAYLRQTS